MKERRHFGLVVVFFLILNTYLGCDLLRFIVVGLSILLTPFFSSGMQIQWKVKLQLT